ncbi:YjcZ family sporulation protein [Halalkalibacter alkaliphilus]|uniref:YjcZ family sporulation protein n=1 Tax=Halalkalibacter alkaliphilus TaxID=2917993 RepID=A0A9X2CPU1_9BACI|nr:YjcZ family sporulation protein [Halalkalibacter alkaliphilus]MCL7746592.1 YjcZ family sporulation protein [Halalkalibacter alkaliphilus]
MYYYGYDSGYGYGSPVITTNEVAGGSKFDLILILVLFILLIIVGACFVSNK